MKHRISFAIATALLLQQFLRNCLGAGSCRPIRRIPPPERNRRISHQQPERSENISGKITKSGRRIRLRIRAER
jgi:hypothetical protein